jgi:hypothetical protein
MQLSRGTGEFTGRGRRQRCFPPSFICFFVTFAAEQMFRIFWVSNGPVDPFIGSLNFRQATFIKMSLPPSHISITTLTPPPSETGSNVNHQTGPYFGHRLFLLSLAFSLVAVCACALLIPLLIAELDDLTTFAREEGKVFKASKLTFLFKLGPLKVSKFGC